MYGFLKTRPILSSKADRMKNTWLVVACCTLVSIFTVFQARSQSTVKTNRNLVVVDPENKQNVMGNITLALAWGELFSPPQQYSRGLINLKDSMTRWTKINAELDRHVMLSSPRLLEMPFVFVSTDQSFDLTANEKANVKKYLESGGFMVLDNPTPQTEMSAAEASLKQMIVDSLGKGTRFAPIPNDHPIYSCFWDFPDGPPIGSELGMFGNDQSDVKSLTEPVLYLQGVWIKNRLAVVFSNKGYVVKWTEMTNNIPQLKMGVNLIVFSLIQEGGLAEKKTVIRK
jgi:hypothetical protein